MKKILVIGLLCGLCIAGCNTLRQDQKNLAKIQVRNPDILHAYCAVTFPLRPSGTSFTPANNPDYTDSIQKLNGKVFDLQQSLENMDLAYRQAIAAASGDTACQSIIKGLKSSIDGLRGQLAAYKAQVQDLQKKYRPCVPDTLRDTIPDLAAVQVQKDIADKINIQLQAALKSNADLERSNAHKMYIIFAMGLIIVVETVYIIKK